jgi:hypothetical protein
MPHTAGDCRRAAVTRRGRLSCRWARLRLVIAGAHVSMPTDATSITLRDGVSDGGARAEIGLFGGERLGAPHHARAGAWTRQHILGLLALSVIIGGSLLLVVLAADRPSIVSATTRSDFFPGWMAGPLGGLWPGLTRSAAALKIVFTVVVLAMYGCYALLMRRIAGLGSRWVIGAILAVQLIFFLSPPLTLTDVFNYINYARMEVVHNLNPYATIPALEPHGDPAYALSNWHDLLSPYGPLFTIITFAVASLGIAAAFWVAKGAIALLSLALLGLVWKCARLLDRDPVEAVAFAGLNPIVLVWGFGGDHNDVFMVFFIMLACWLLLRAGAGRDSSQTPPGGGALAQVRSWLLPLAVSEVAAGTALAAAVFVKASGAIVVPIFLAALLRAPRRAVQTLIGLVVGGVLLATLSYLVFGAHVPSVITQGSLVTGLSVPNLLGMALGLGGETGLLREAVALVLVGVVIACCVLAYRRREIVTPAGWATIGLLLTLAWVLPWYILWALPLVALSSSSRLRMAMALLSVYLIVVWVPSASDLTGAIGLHPEKTSLGKQHQRVVRELMN